MLVQKCAHNYINLKNGYQPIQLDNTTFRTTGMYNFVCMEMCSKTDSMENNYNKITVVNVYRNYMLDSPNNYGQIIFFSCQDDNGTPEVCLHLQEKLLGFNGRGTFLNFRIRFECMIYRVS